MPSDYFALLGVRRRPWIDPEEVQSKFLEASVPVHPDRVHTGTSQEKTDAHEQFTALNAACQCLRDPKQRLKHLLEIERGAPLNHLETLPAGAADLYFQIGKACRECDGVLAGKSTATSPLLKVQFFSRALEQTEKLEALQESLQRQLASAEVKLKELNAAWEAKAADEISGARKSLPLDQLESVFRELSYIMRWLDQIRQRLVELSL